MATGGDRGRADGGGARSSSSSSGVGENGEEAKAKTRLRKLFAIGEQQPAKQAGVGGDAASHGGDRGATQPRVSSEVVASSRASSAPSNRKRRSCSSRSSRRRRSRSRSSSYSTSGSRRRRPQKAAGAETRDGRCAAGLRRPPPPPPPPRSRGGAGGTVLPSAGDLASRAPTGRPRGMLEHPRPKLCLFFRSPGGCKWGESCGFAHFDSELVRKVDRDWAAAAGPDGGAWVVRESRCYYWSRAECKWGDNCSYAHGKSQIGTKVYYPATGFAPPQGAAVRLGVGGGREPPAKIVCQLWKRGQCTLGKNCSFVHEGDRNSPRHTRECSRSSSGSHLRGGQPQDELGRSVRLRNSNPETGPEELGAALGSCAQPIPLAAAGRKSDKKSKKRQSKSSSSSSSHGSSSSSRRKSRGRSRSRRKDAQRRRTATCATDGAAAAAQLQVAVSEADTSYGQVLPKCGEAASIPTLPALEDVSATPAQTRGAQAATGEGGSLAASSGRPAVTPVPGFDRKRFLEVRNAPPVLDGADAAPAEAGEAARDAVASHLRRLVELPLATLPEYDASLGRPVVSAVVPLEGVCLLELQSRAMCSGAHRLLDNLDLLGTGECLSVRRMAGPSDADDESGRC